MLNSSLRRVARTCSSTPSTASRPGTPTSITASFTSHSHQRRHSSSKPPIPPKNGPPAIPASSVKIVGGPRTKDPSDKRAGAESRLSKRRVSRDKVDGKQPVQDQWTMNLPSVPSTQHLSRNDVCLASFFSIHRPISITSPFPASVSTEDFDKIFEPKAKSSKSRPGPHEVIYTLSSAVQHLDENINQRQQEQSGQHDQAVAARADIIQALTQHNNEVSNPADPNQPVHLDGKPQSREIRVPNGVKIVIQEIAKRFRPYNTPPAPVAISDAELEAREAEEEANDEAQARQLEVQIENQDQERESRIQTVVLTLHENDNLEKRQFFTPHGLPAGEQHDVLEVSEPLEGIPRRQGGRQSWQDIYHAISVKRQRKLKMKKHKYKKLMRKTRNLRRRQDKL